MVNREYTADDIQLLDVDDHLHKHQEMYFGSRGANPESIASSVAEGALTLGARRTMVAESDGWWFVCADIDWLPAARIKGDNNESVFGCLYAFPEAGVNWYRSEAMTRVFSDQAFRLSGSRFFE